VESQPREGTSLSREISRGIVAIYKDHLGRGPTKVRTTITDDMVVTVLEDGLTKAEEKLVARDRAHAVRSIRREFQESMSDEVKALVENLTGREVKCLLSDHSPDPDYAVEVLLLAGAS
jgi:uncharacterized protein YbcI